MTITIPVWVLWIFGVPVLLFVLFWAVMGFLFLHDFKPFRW